MSPAVTSASSTGQLPSEAGSASSEPNDATADGDASHTDSDASLVTEDASHTDSDASLVTEDANQSDAGTLTPDGAITPEGELGAACRGDDACASNHCVSDVCCDTACDAVCGSCTVPGQEGTCSAVDTDDTCPALQCPTNTACRSFSLPEVGNCEALGMCKTEVDCDISNQDETTSCAGGEGLCDGEGSCFVPDKLSLGEGCDADDECAEGECVDAAAGGGKICCDGACNGTCQACGSDGHCDEAPADDNACAVINCPGDTSCTSYPNNLTSNRCVGFGQCATVQTYCQPDYQSEGHDCGSGLECDGQGSCDSVCNSNQAWCTSYCANPLTDDDHCGVNSACSGGSVCGGNTACENGSCLVQCSETEARCSNTCVDPAADVQHCGASGSCSGGEAGDVCAATGACV